MTLHDAIKAAEAVFMSKEVGFADDITYIPQGVTANQFTVVGRINWDDREGTNQIRGEGRTGLNQSKGRSVRNQILIDLPTHYTNDQNEEVPLVVNTNGKDRMLVAKHGSSKTVQLVVKRMIGSDPSEQTVLCHFVTTHATQTHKSRMG